MKKLTPSERMKKAWISRRAKGSVIPWNKVEPPEKYEFVKLYTEKMMSTRALGVHYQVSQMQIRGWLKALAIPRRKRADAPSGRPPMGEKHWNWMGDNVSYQALHAWVRTHKGTPKHCEHCGDTSKKKYEWANKSGKYLRNLEDWIRLCTSCHRLYDNSK